jgi:SAM-dependent methyltransferase
MIPKLFHIFWCGNEMSFLRYLTILTAKHHNPDWEVHLYLSDKYTHQTWQCEAQDFQQTFTDNWLEQAKQAADHVHNYDKHPEVAPNFQSDFFRWDTLLEHGGFYLDADQLILKSFNDLLKHNFIYALYEGNGPVGVLGAVPGCRPVKFIHNRLQKYYNPANYNSIGPQMFTPVMNEMMRKDWFPHSGSFNSKKLFYPIPHSHLVPKIYNGQHVIPKESYALHWFGGHPISQEFNKNFSKRSLKTGNDTISKYCREVLNLDREISIMRWDIIQDIINKFNYQSYLEIGVDHKKLCWNNIKINYKIGVDPNVPTTFRMGSDMFFRRNKEKFDIIFIDGLHERNQVLRDVNNSLRFLNPNGTIVVHDCNPCEPKRLGPMWSGTVWEAIAMLRSSRSDLFIKTITEDTGIAIIRPGQQKLYGDTIEYSYEYLDGHRQEMLALIDIQTFTKLLESRFQS